MKTLKKLPQILIVASIIYFSSCAKTDPLTPDTGNTRDNLVAQWSCTENSKSGGNTTFAVNITKSTSNSTQVLMDNFYNLGTANKAIIDVSGSTLIIPSQPPLLGNNILGTGTFVSSHQINLAYTVNNGASIDSCTAILTK